LKQNGFAWTQKFFLDTWDALFVSNHTNVVNIKGSLAAAALTGSTPFLRTLLKRGGISGSESFGLST